VKKFISWNILLLFIITITLSPINASAHTDNSEGYSNITLDRDKLNVALYMDYFELGRLIDFEVQPGSSRDQLKLAMEDQQDTVSDYLATHFELFMDGVKSEGMIKATEVVKRTNRDYAKIMLEFPRPAKEKSIQIQYSVFFDDNDPMHRNIATYNLDKEKGQFVFHGGERELQIGKETIIGQIIRFIQLGFHHIMIGYDHILFVIALVLGTRRFSDILKIITVFTLAHSITLGLTALKLINLPSEIIEPLIALSIAFVALEHFFGFSTKLRFAVVFGFGLIHGVGFAGALQLSNDVTWRSLLSILSFNVGVEVGQALIIMLLFPILLYIRRFKWSTVVYGTATAGIFGMGLIWYFERFLA
jgi:hydrogenase/urease accessory protein HupE